MSDPVEMPARNFTFEVNSGTPSVPDYLRIGGLNNWTHSPTANDVDTRKFSNGGRLSHMKISRGDAFTMTGLYLVDPLDGVVDPGQAECEAWSEQIGHKSRRLFRITNDITGKAKTFVATVVVTVSGGGDDDVQSFEMTVTVDGAITSSGAPVLPNAPTAVSGSAAAGFTIVSLTAPTDGGTPTKYEAVVVLASDGTTVVATVTASTKPLYVPVAAGSNKVKVRAKNAKGWGPFSALSSAFTTS